MDRFLQKSRRAEELTEYCGRKKPRSVAMPDCDDPEPKVCNRVYEVYFPSTACPKNGENITEQHNIMPLVFAVHCFSCHPEDMYYWQTIAQKYQFVLVIPHGFGNTFNAEQCCGVSMDKNIDDFGFFEGIIADLSTNFGSIVSDKLVYGVGHENGGYMVAHAANLFRAIAPIAGYHVELPKLKHPVGLFMHHSKNDPSAMVTGCCEDPAFPQCGHGLTNVGENCTSAKDFFENFADKVNKCGGETHVSAMRADKGGTVCYTAGSHCKANTTYCEYNQGANFHTLGRDFPMTSEVADFFARDACSIGHGDWSGETNQCYCKDVNNTAAFCLDEMPNDIPILIISMIVSGLLVLILGVAYWRRESAEEKKYREFVAISTVELSDIDDDEFPMKLSNRL